MRYHFIPVRMTNIQKANMTNASKEKMKFSCTVGGNVN